MIVNSTATHMSLKLGKVATALLNKAGYALQEECTRKAPLYIGDVIATEGYGLNCDHVFHVSCPDWVQGTSEEASKSNLQHFVSKQFIISKPQSHKP